jgi:hypothetical protein
MRSCLCARLFSMGPTILCGKRNMLLDCLQRIHTPHHPRCLDSLTPDAHRAGPLIPTHYEITWQRWWTESFPYDTIYVDELHST